MFTTTTNTRPRPVNTMADTRDHKRARRDEEIGTLSLITPIEEKPDAFSVEFVENRELPAPTPLTPEPDVDIHDDALPQGIQETDDEVREHWFVGSVDQGTTSSRFLIFNGEGEPVANHQIEFEQHYPESG